MVLRIDQGISEHAVLLFGFERGSESIAVAAVGPPFPRLSSRPKYACSPLAGELELALLPTSKCQTAKNHV